MTTINYKEKFNKNQFELSAWQEHRFICGLDEVGRGCLAGPVVTAAVILFAHKKSPLIKDSKLLDEQGLQKAYAWIIKNAWFSYGIINNRDVDTFNIYQATLRAMKRTIMQLLINCPQAPQKILIDAMPVNLTGTPYEHIDVIHFTSGERKSSSIAAASIIAKVTRDNLMRRLDPLFPAYQLAKHKGYGTRIHQEALKTHGRSILHRMTFLHPATEPLGQQMALPFCPEGENDHE